LLYAAGIRRLLNDDALYEELRQANLNQAQHFTVDKAAKIFMDEILSHYGK